MQHQLSWQQRRKVARLLLLYKALYGHIALQIPPYYTLSYSNTGPKFPEPTIKSIIPLFVIKQIRNICITVASPKFTPF